MPPSGLSGRRLGGFELLEPLGAGAFATVWRARQLRLGRDVAVKVLDPALSLNPDAARRFEREGRAAAGLDHPSIVPVYEAGEEDGIVYLAMRLVDGRTLAEELATGAPLTAARTLAVVEPVAAALDHAHAQGLIHLDVKPSNVLLEGPRVFLADFGIAASARDVGRYTTGAIGTAAYMAPEQARPGEIDARADLYSLGCVVFECLTGRPPFEHDDLLAVLMAHATAPIPTTGDARLDTFFARALAKDPADRFESGTALADALRQATGGAGGVPTQPLAQRPTAPLPPPPAEARRSRRWRTPLAIAVAAVVLAGTAAVVARSGDDGGGTDAGPTTAPPTTAAPAILEGGTVVVAHRSEPISRVNPHTELAAEGLISGNVLPSLFVQHDEMAWQPHLADGPPEVLATDPFTVRWRLRADATWDDGSPITATDVARTLDYIRDPATDAAATTLYDRIVSLDVLDERTFTATFVEPMGEPRVLFSTIHPVIKAASLDRFLASGGAPADYLATEIDYSGGPFQLAGFEPEREARLVRNDAWWGTPSHLDRVTVRLLDTGPAAIDAVATGDADVALVSAPQLDDVRRARDVEGAATRLVPAVLQFGLQFNVGADPLGDLNVRRAMALALDRPALAEALSAGDPDASPPGSLVFFPGQPGYVDDFAVYQRDLDEADLLLTQSGWTLDDDGRRVRDGSQLAFDLLIPPDDLHTVKLTALALLIGEQLSDVGIAATSRQVTADELTTAWQTGDFQLTLSIAVMSTDAMIAVERWSGNRCPSSVAGCTAPSGLNFWRYDDPVVTDLLERTSDTTDQAERLDLFQQAGTALAANPPAIPLVQPPLLVVGSDRLAGVSTAVDRAGPLADAATWGWLEG